MNITGCPIGIQLSRLSEHSNSALIADAAEGHWQAIHRTLSAVIGAQGVAALYRRSVHLARARFPWLTHPDPSDAQSKPLDALHASLSAQPSADAAAAQLALLQTFNDLLESLIGSPLTDRWLGPVWGMPPANRDAEDHDS